MDRFSPLILDTASQFEYEQDRAEECFLYVCGQLCDDGFRRLLRFNTRGRAKFRTWLTSVVFNLCVDWHRREYGRVRMLPAIAALPAFDQAVYRLAVDQGMSKESCYQVLRVDFPDIDRRAIDRSLGRVYSILTPRQHWQMSVRSRRRKQRHGNDPPTAVERLPDQGPGPEGHAEQKQELEALRAALSGLPSKQRLLIQLRFQEGLSLEKIAQLQQLGDSSRAWRHIQSAIEALSRQLSENQAGVRRKN